MTRISSLLAMAVIALSGAAQAATIAADEAAANGRDFGDNPNQSEVFAADILTITGTQKNNRDSDYLSFDGFSAGTRSLDFLFTNAGGDWGSFNIRIKQSAFKNTGDWWPLVYSASVGSVTDTRSHAISYVLDGYTGPLHVAIDFFDADFRNGNGLSYTVTKTGLAPQPAPSAVPLPPGLSLAAAALGALWLTRRLRRRG